MERVNPTYVLSFLLVAGLCWQESATAGQFKEAQAPQTTSADRNPSPGLVRDRPVSLRLTSFQESEMERMTTSDSAEESWEIDGPVFLRSADPEPPGEVVIKNIFEWETTKDDGDDDFEYELEIEWGVVENHELIFETPFEIGDGRVDGNGDLTVGWHWRLWKEHDGWPAFGMRNYVRIPTGVDSSGVDYEWRGLITKTLIPGTTRLELNPFVASINGNNEEDARPFRWGVAIGIDHRLRDDLLLIADYIYANGELERTRDNHSAEFGLDWHIDERQTLAFATEVGLDGDSDGASLAARISYILSFGG